MNKARNFKISYSAKTGFILLDISMRKSGQMYIGLITSWETFPDTNLTFTKTLFSATVCFFKKDLFKRILSLKFCQLKC